MLRFVVPGALVGAVAALLVGSPDAAAPKPFSFEPRVAVSTFRHVAPETNPSAVAAMDWGSIPMDDAAALSYHKTAAVVEAARYKAWATVEAARVGKVRATYAR